MKSINWTALVLPLFLALPLSRPLIGQGRAPGKSASIVLFGHSHVERWKVTSLAGFPTINRGRGGDRTQDLVDRFERDVVPNHPRAVVLWAFDNDVMDAPNRDTTAATKHATANLLKLIEMAKAHAIEPILTTEVTIRPADSADPVANRLLSLVGKAPYHERINTEIVEWNGWVREQAQRRRLLLLDFQRALADQSDRRRPQYADPDGVHLTREAYAVITARAEATLSASLRR